MDDKTESMISLFNLLRQTYGLNRKRISSYGLDSLETFIMISIKRMSEPTQITLSEKFQAPKQTINNIIMNLKDKEFIEMNISENDGRKKLLVLTPKGEKRLEEILKPVNSANRRLFEDLGKEKVSEIIENLKILNISLERNLLREDI